MIKALPTPPGIRAGDDRPELLAGAAFLDGTTSEAWDVRALARWFDDNLVETGCMFRPSVISEPPVGQLALRPSGAAAATADVNLRRVLAAARARVLSALRGLRASPPDDRFLSAAIFSGRVRRQSAAARSEWAAKPEQTAPLSAIVLSLFAVDILSHREQYDRELCLCEVCGHLWFDPEAEMRTRCTDHLPGAGGRSGCNPAVTPDE